MLHVKLFSCQLRPTYAPGSGSPFQNISEIVKPRMHTEVAYFSRAERVRIFVCRRKASPNMKVVVQLVRRYISGHKGPVSCLLTFLASTGEVLLAFHITFYWCCSEGSFSLEYIGEVLTERAALRINSEKNLESRSLFL